MFKQLKFIRFFATTKHSKPSRMFMLIVKTGNIHFSVKVSDLFLKHFLFPWFEEKKLKIIIVTIETRSKRWAVYNW